jgi:hypothetical protein
MQATPLSYLLTNPGALGLSLARPSAALLFLLVAVFFLRPHPGGRRVTWLRSAAFTAVVATLAGLHLTVTLPSRERALIAAIDVSDSVGDPGLDWAKQLLAQTRRSLAPGEDLVLLTFAEDVDLPRDDDGTSALDALQRGPHTAATDLEKAIDNALALFPPDRERILLLLTDGNETSGDSRRLVPAYKPPGSGSTRRSHPRIRHPISA